MQRRMVMLKNLNCPSCAAKLEKATQHLDGVKTAKVAFAAGTLTVEFDEQHVKPEQIKEIVHQFGVEVANGL